MKKYIVTTLFVSLFTISCSQTKNTLDKDVRKKEKVTLSNKVIQNLAQSVILHTYQELSKKSENLSQSVAQLSVEPTQENLDLAADAWRQTRIYWEQTESFLFGPVESLSIDPMIDTWPLNQSDLESILSSNNKITPEVIRTLGTNLKGFHTIEYLLFGNGVQTNQKLIAHLSQKEIEYLLATSQVLAEDCQKLTNGWEAHHNPDVKDSLPYISYILNPGLDNEFYSSEQAVVLELINGMIGIADEVANGKIADPLGGSIEQADTTAVESPFSWNSISDFTDNLKSIRMIYTGDREDHSGLGIIDLLNEKNPLLAQQVLNQIDQAINKVQNIKGETQTPFREAILNPKGRQRVLEAQKAVNLLFETLDQQVLPQFQ
ncbi:MAG: iron-regulated protein A precursor [Bdellovibrionales bacterium]|nr:iron-regulated protein A precursor [Bdellovibrionales bacterium]